MKKSTRAKKEIKNLEAASSLGRITGEQREGVKESSTKGYNVRAQAEKTTQKAHVQAKLKRLEELREQKLSTSKSGSKSELTLLSETRTKMLLGQPVEGLETEKVGGLTVEAPVAQVGTPSRVAPDAKGPQLEPGNLDAEMFSDEDEDIKQLMKRMLKNMVTKDDLTALATKDDLVQLKEEVKEEVANEVAEQVQGVKEKLTGEVRQVVKKEVQKLESRVSTLQGTKERVRMPETQRSREWTSRASRKAPVLRNG